MALLLGVLLALVKPLGWYLRVYMAQLRRKIEADPAQPRFLLTEPGVGYRIREAEGFDLFPPGDP